MILMLGGWVTILFAWIKSEDRIVRIKTEIRASSIEQVEESRHIEEVIIPAFDKCEKAE